MDLQLMIQNYTVPALAAGLRDREETLQLCAQLLADEELAQLEKVGRGVLCMQCVEEGWVGRCFASLCCHRGSGSDASLPRCSAPLLSVTHHPTTFSPLKQILHPYQAGLITRRRRKTRSLDLQGGITSQHLNMLRKYLQRSPRHLTR